MFLPRNRFPLATDFVSPALGKDKGGFNLQKTITNRDTAEIFLKTYVVELGEF